MSHKGHEEYKGTHTHTHTIQTVTEDTNNPSFNRVTNWTLSISLIAGKFLSQAICLSTKQPSCQWLCTFPGDRSMNKKYVHKEEQEQEQGEEELEQARKKKKKCLQ